MKHLLLFVLLIATIATQAQQPAPKYKVGDTAFCGIVFYVKMDSICTWFSTYMRDFQVPLDTVKTPGSFIQRRDTIFFVDTFACSEKTPGEKMIKAVFYRDTSVTIYATYNLVNTSSQFSMYGQHGLVCGTTDAAISIPWDTGYLATNAIIDILFDKLNAERIIARLGNGYSYAALVAKNYLPLDTACRGWYLPSASELGLMYSNLAAKGMGSFTKEGYWSSVEMADSVVSRAGNATQRKAWLVDFFDGKTFTVDKVNKYHIRAIKEFWVRN